MNEPADTPPVSPLPPVPDLEIKDAQLIFSAVWDDLLERHGCENLRFPREFIWLGGARARARAPTRRLSPRRAASPPRRSWSAAC